MRWLDQMLARVNAKLENGMAQALTNAQTRKALALPPGQDASAIGQLFFADLNATEGQQIVFQGGNEVYLAIVRRDALNHYYFEMVARQPRRGAVYGAAHATAAKALKPEG